MDAIKRLTLLQESLSEKEQSLDALGAEHMTARLKKARLLEEDFGFGDLPSLKLTLGKMLVAMQQTEKNIKELTIANAQASQRLEYIREFGKMCDRWIEEVQEGKEMVIQAMAPSPIELHIEDEMTKNKESLLMLEADVESLVFENTFGTDSRASIGLKRDKKILTGITEARERADILLQQRRHYYRCLLRK